MMMIIIIITTTIITVIIIIIVTIIIIMIIATNQFAHPVLNYLMWTQHWPITELRVVDRETRKIIHENGGKHSLSSAAVISTQTPRRVWPVEQEYKLTKIKAAVRLYQNANLTMKNCSDV